MAVKKDNRPVVTDDTMDNNAGVITYANEVVAIMAGVAASEVEGIAGMCTSGGLADIIGRNKNITRGVKVDVGTEEASVDLYVIMEYGKPIQKACSEVQENVRKNIESMTGLHVVRVDVHVQGVSFEKENRDAQRNLETGNVPYIAPVAEEQAVQEPVIEAPVAEEPVAEEPVAEDPVAEEPVAEEPVAEESIVEEPVAEEPAPEAQPELPIESVLDAPFDAQDEGFMTPAPDMDDPAEGQPEEAEAEAPQPAPRKPAPRKPAAPRKSKRAEDIEA